MKKITCVVLLFFLFQGLNAQTWSEWFRQKKTQIKYLVEQIAAFKAYGDVAWKGYTLAKDGLTDIGVIKDHDLAMHSDYFASLQTVNPTVKASDKVAQIAALQAAVLTRYETLKKLVRSGALLTSDEVLYINKVLAVLLDGCTDDVNALIVLTTGDASEMKDNERMVRVDALYLDMQDKYAFLQHFSTQTRVLLLQRRGDAADDKAIKGLFGIQ